ncbi:sister chromatid cohesion protein 1 [Borealophlyctis nickersoniae]|nr:sister chromatid cohesion protein 1 [Borealophlyctis nickersoniae]
MFYSETILSKRGPLAKVWLAANWERKLSKSQFLQTNIEAVVGTMLGGNQPPMALRLSAQLLLGVVRIYSRKARYLLEDCNEALMKIKMHFRPGAVDMPDHSVANVNAITMADAMTEFDILLPEPSFDLRSFLAQPPEDSTPASLNISRSQDITLADTSFVAGAHEEELRDIFGLEDTNPEDLAGGWSLGLGLGEEEAPPGPAESSGPVDDSMEIEVGRDAAAEQPFSPGRRESLSFADDPSFSRDKDISLPEFGEPMDMDRLPEGEELFPGGEIELPPLSAGEEEPELFQVPDTVEVRSPEPEPETAVRDQKKKAQSRKRKLIVDDAIEMDNDQFLKAINDTSDILQEQRFVPASRKMQKLLDIRAQGAAYYLNTPAYDDYPAELQFLFRVRTRTVAQTGEETTARKRKAESIEPAAEEREPEGR